MKGLGWYLDEQDLAQVSMNLTDYEVTPLHVAFEECSKDAKVQLHVTYCQRHNLANFILSSMLNHNGDSSVSIYRS